MRRAAFIMACLMLSLGLLAQEKTVILHHQGNVLYQTPVSNIDNIRFVANPNSAVFNNQAGQNTFPLTEIDSLTFGTYEIPEGDTVYITYNGNDVEVVNPFANDGVVVETSQGNASVYSTKAGVCYVVSGTSTNGSLTLSSNSALTLILDGADLQSGNTAALNIGTACDVNMTLRGASTLSDYANSSVNGALYAAGNLVVDGTGILNVYGNAKHGISVDGSMTVNAGEINILETDSDGIHVGGNFLFNDGSLAMESLGTDGLDVSGTVTLHDGEVSIHSSATSSRGIKVSGAALVDGGHLGITMTGGDSKGIKGDSDITLSGGIFELTLSGEGSNGISSDTHIGIQDQADITIVNSAYDGKCFKSDGTMSIDGGTVELTHSGDLSKGIKTVGVVTINGGELEITASGSTVMETVDGQNVPSYCTAIKSDSDVVINGGTLQVTLPTSNQGGKGVSADGGISISGGDISIETHGNGATYTVSGSTKDAYTSSCLKCDGDMSITGGSLSLSSTGTGGKGINVGDDDSAGTLTIGMTGGDDDDLSLDVSTSGERITVSSGGGGWWGGGDYANPKAIKSKGNLTINSGTITVNCTQNNEGGECIESKAAMVINGGHIEAYSKSDDVINASSSLTINGGTIYVHSDNNDGTDSNGTLTINGGLIISNGARQPEEGFDCDNNMFKISGGTAIGTGGATSNPTSSVCTQPTLKINTQSGYAIQILKSDGTVICTYQCPTLSGGGGGWPGGGGGSGLVMLFTDPQLQVGQSYTIKYNGNISGESNWNGYYTGNVSYSGGSSNNFSVSSMYTTISAGGSGW